ncbi:MAG TPA: hypothetical protein VL576_02735 [Candidatus Paceibacterota bacterium]|nr:hypothetical protein [Candidatus Paceibacterota bacterium]
MERKHFYKNYEEVISILTKDYGFRYDGLGDNYEECFRKLSDKPETIFIHPMFCSYYMASSHALFAERFHEFNVKSDHKSEKSQLITFRKLLIHLDEVSMKEDLSTVSAVQKIPDIKEELLVNTLAAEPKKLTLWQRLRPW